jgi:type I restriction enzyme S subunit
MTAFPRYSKSKDSGVEWLGDVPEHWETLRAKHLFVNVSDKGFPDEPLLSATQDEGVVPRDSREQRVVMPLGQLEAFKLVKENDFVISLRSFQGGIEHSRYRGLVSPAYTVLRQKRDVNPNYLRHLLKASNFISELNVSVTGIRQGKNIDFGAFAESFIPIPPRAEQDRIVAFLDEKTAEIDRLIAKKQRQIELLDEQKAILINRAVTRGLNVKAPIKDSGVDWIGSIPAHWEMKKLRWLLAAAPKNGVSPPITESGDVPTLSISAVKNGKVSFGEHLKLTKIARKERQAFEIKPGDLLALRGNGSRHLVATCGQVGVNVPHGCIYPDLLIKLVAGPSLDAAYLIHLLNGPLRQVIHLVAKTSAGIWKVSGESLGALKMPLPPREEQSEIVLRLFEAETAYSQARSKIESQIQTLQTLRSTLIAHAVTGKLRIC